MDYTEKSLNEEYSEPIKVGYTRDLTHLVYKGKGPNVIGRERELNRLISILCKKNKNNPVLIGEPGVGKTALVYALAERIVANQINPKLRGTHILEFDIVSAVAGTKYRGEFEEKINEFLGKIKRFSNDKKIILCIDEIHEIVGVGAAEGAVDLSAMFKPFLLESSVKVIGTSTFKDYRRIEADKALERRFDTVKVDEPSFEETAEILKGLKSSFERFHKVKIHKDAIDTALTLSKRYIPERFWPDKAIDLLDEACAIKANFFDKRTRMVLPEDIFTAISIKKGIPIGKIQEAYDLANLEENLNSKVIGQPHASSAIATAIRRAKAGLNDENRPLASFMFIGPTGVGKTEMAKALADLVFSGKDNIIRFDMSEYMEEHSVSKLIGSPPGYVGYEESGLLTEQVRQNPYSLVLFDEFEKAHPKICNLLLQILDEGSLTDSKGQHINFKNTIIILTSNVGSDELSQKSITGFGEQPSSTGKNNDVMTSVKKRFPPEFLNRLDEIIQFNYLSEKDVFEIAKLYVLSLIKKVKSLKIKINISDEVISKIAKLGYSKEYGARELRRTIDREIKNPLADLILKDHVNHIYVELVNGNIKISQNGIVTPV